ncbi:glycosyltransferase family 39 protein [Candidatus Woesebacteria bacterium]|nr:MAG: glycosyltransferase family 39 protein [Candidatus Woesebacteria bacterium]
MKRYSLLAILVIAAFLRIWNLGVNPPHLTPDEAALGYNAYSILKTGRDEYGKLLPIVFKSFGDYKPGLYVYATVPFVFLFDLNEVSVRLASSLSGIFAVFIIYHIVNLLLEVENKKNKGVFSPALLSSLILAISPWHIHFSRGAWEINIALTLTLLGIYCVLKSFTNNKYLIPAALSFGATLTAYQGAKLSSLIVLFLLAIIYRKKISKINLKVLVLSFFVGLIVAFPIIASFSKGETGRLKVFSVFSYTRPQEYLTDLLATADVKFGSPEYYLYYSENLNITKGIMGRWFNHFSPRFLFFEGDWQNPRHSAPSSGEMLFVDSLFLLCGLYILINANNTGARFILLWLLLAPLPSALSRDQIHAVRSYNMVIPLVVVTAFGLSFFSQKVSEWGKVKYVGILGVFLLYLASVFYFLDAYFVHQPIHNARYWDYGYKQLVEIITPIQHDYKKVKIHFTYAQPYIYFLFYQKYDPATYQKNAYLEESRYGDVGRVTNLDNISFEYLNWTTARGDFGTLFAADSETIPIQDSVDPGEFKQIGEITLPTGEMIFRLVEVLDESNVNRYKVF